MAKQTSKMAPRPTKMVKTKHSCKSWSHEDRLFGEKVFYLNKSTTKYVNIGLDPESLSPLVRICDRVSGCYITIKKKNFNEFTRIISSIINYSCKLDRGYIKRSALLCGIKFCAMGKNIWKLTQVGLDYATVHIHEANFRTYLRIAPLISVHLDEYDPVAYNQYIEELRCEIGEKSEDEIIKYLYEQLTKFKSGQTEHQVLTDLICNQESYMDLEKFNAEFYNRNTLYLKMCFEFNKMSLS